MLSERFWQKVRKTDSCWEWLGAKSSSGYGKAWSPFHKKHMDVHRLSYEAHAEPPGKSLVLHRCDNKLCIRPDHLFLGSHRDNTMDMIAKGRAPNMKLNQSCARQIREALMAGKERKTLAAEYGVSKTTITMIALGRAYRESGA